MPQRRYRSFASLAQTSQNYFAVYVGGSPRNGDTVSVTAFDATIFGSEQETATYNCVSGNSPNDVAANLAAQINSTMSNIGVIASASGSSIILQTATGHSTSFSATAPANLETVSVAH